jgi:hypothetical protein
VSLNPHLRRPEAQLLLDHLPPEHQVALGHVLDCPACGRLVESLLGPPLPPPADHKPPDSDDVAVWASLAAGRQEAADRLAAERGPAEGALADLLAADAAGRLRRIREEARFRSLALAALLLERSQAAVAAVALEEAEELAHWAVLILEWLDPAEEPRSLLLELRVCGWGLVARARWEAQRWDPVVTALECAEGLLLEAGHGTQHLGFRRVQAAFRTAERRAAEAFVRLAQAVQQLVGHLTPEPDVPAAQPHGEEN